MLRCLLGIGAASVCCILAFTEHQIGTSQAQTVPIPVPVSQPNKVDPEMPLFLFCAEVCDECASMCESCSAHCVEMLAKGEKKHHMILRLCQDCAAICQSTSRVTAKDGPMAKLIVAACAEACKKCAEECSKVMDDPMLHKCSDMCLKCEKVCREFIKK